MKPSATTTARNLGRASMTVTLATAGFALYLHESAPTSASLALSVGGGINCVVTLFALAFLWVIHYWNLFGYWIG